MSGLQKFKNGYKPLGVPVLEPFFIKKMEISQAPTKAVAVSQKYTNLYVHGMTRSNVTKMKFTLEKNCGWVMDVQSPQINLIGDYELRGKILMFPLNAHGRCNITLTNLHHRQIMKCEQYKKNDKTYLRFANYTIDMNPESIHYDFSNIFPANKQIQAEIRKMVNENSLVLFNDVRMGFQEAFSIFHMDIANLVFSKIPMDDVFTP
nr:protein takeout-like [Leptinotarsa decemlineata]